MSTRRFNLNSPAKIFATLLAVVFSALCYAYQVEHPVCCDAGWGAGQYISLGYSMLKDGVFRSDLKLYGYPSFVAVNIGLAALLHAPFGFVLYLTQTGLYLLAVHLLSRQLSLHFSPVTANAAFFALLANVFVYPYLAISLTDGLSVVVLLFLGYVILKILAEPLTLPFGRKRVFLYMALGFLLGYAIMLRPANIGWLLLLLPVAWVWRMRNHDARVSIRAGVITLMGFVLAVAPELRSNWLVFHRFTLLPVQDLGAHQIQWGIGYVKYATSMVHGAAPLIYANPAPHGSAETIAWYFNNPLDGIQTVLLHVFSAFDFDYLFPYIYDYTPSYRPALFLFSHLIVFWAAVGGVLAIRSARQRVGDGQAVLLQRLMLALLLCLISGWLAVHALSAVENRFALPVVTAVLPLAAWALLVKTRQLSARNWLFAAFGVYLLLAWQLSEYISGLKVI